MIEPKPENDLPETADGASDPSASTENQRDSLRHAVQLRVDYKRMNTFFADYAKNISKGGTFIRTSKPLDVGTEFVFVLSIPEQAHQLELRGEVIWTVIGDQATDDRPAGMGIRFRFEGDDEREALERFVETLMADKLGSHVTAKLLGRS
jgi:type IV pilus assembly protein PilZ